MGDANDTAPTPAAGSRKPPAAAPPVRTFARSHGRALPCTRVTCHLPLAAIFPAGCAHRLCWYCMLPARWWLPRFERSCPHLAHAHAVPCLPLQTLPDANAPQKHATTAANGHAAAAHAPAGTSNGSSGTQPPVPVPHPVRGADATGAQPPVNEALLRDGRAAEGAALQLTAVLQRHMKRVNGDGPAAAPTAARHDFAVAMVPFSPAVPRPAAPASGAPRGQGLRVQTPESRPSAYRRSPRAGPTSARSTASTVATPLGSPLGSPLASPFGAAAAATESPASSSRRRGSRNPRARRRRTPRVSRARAPKTPAGRVYNPRLEFCAIIRTFADASRGAARAQTAHGSASPVPPPATRPAKRARLESPAAAAAAAPSATAASAKPAPGSALGTTAERPPSPTVVLLGVTPAELDFTCDHSEFLEFPG